VSLLLSAMIDPLADWFQKRHISRGLAVVFVYAIFLAVIVGIVLLIVPTIIEQSTALLTKYAPYIEQAFGNTIDVQTLLSGDLLRQDFRTSLLSIQQAGLAEALPQVLEFLTAAFGGVITLILILILSFYMVVEENALKKSLTWLTPMKYEPLMVKILPKVRRQIGAWLRAQLLVMFIIFAVTYIALLIVGLPYALVLAIIAGVLEIVPFIGPILSAVPAILIALSISPWHALIIVAIYFGIQQLEGDVLTPKVMQKIGGINPIVSIIAVLIGWELFKVIGVLLAIPAAMIVIVFLKEIYSRKPPARV
ncbi:AI-2E family transporter, partial [Patescibacteria group bacterium]|nr:AI-2E family transporter [Patescibacteria group bacterium]